MSDQKDAKPSNEFVICGPDLGNGQKAALKLSEEGISAGTLSDQIQPNGEFLELQRVENSPIMRVIGKGKNYGPAKVNSQQYRNGWENIFGNRQAVGKA